MADGDVLCGPTLRQVDRGDGLPGSTLLFIPQASGPAASLSAAPVRKASRMDGACGAAAQTAASEGAARVSGDRNAGDNASSQNRVASWAFLHPAPRLTAGVWPQHHNHLSQTPLSMACNRSGVLVSISAPRARELPRKSYPLPKSVLYSSSPRNSS